MKRIWSYMFSVVLLVLPNVPAVAQADTPAVCLIGDHPGIPDSDAQTAALLVCDELHKQGISVTDPVYEAPASADVYRVVLRRLGEKIIVRLSKENPVGTIIIERQIVLANIEEMIPAAPRLVDALVHDKPIDATVDMETVLEQEARELRKISGESLWHMGIFGTFIPGTDVAAEPGMEFGWSYQTPSYAVGTDFRYSGPDDDDDASKTIRVFAWSIGGRYFFNKRSIAPYVGGGFAVIDASYRTKVRKKEILIPAFLDREEVSRYYDDYESEDDSGLGVYGVVGIELLRLTQSRMNVELRIDRPFFSLPSQDIMPITFGISFSRNYVPGGSGCFLF